MNYITNKLFSVLIMLLLIPSTVFSISFEEMQSNSNRFKKVLETFESTTYVDVDSIRSLRYAPPYYTMQADVYTVVYETNLIIQSHCTFNYDYNRSFAALSKEAKEKSSQMFNGERDWIFSELRRNSGITCSEIGVAFYSISGELLNEIKKENGLYNARIPVASPIYESAIYVFYKYYDCHFFPVSKYPVKAKP